MNSLLKANNLQVKITFKICHLTVETISQEPTLQIVNPNTTNITLDVSSIQSVDACGIGWLMNVVNKYFSLGLKVTLTENRIIQEAMAFLDLDTLTEEQIHFIPKAV
ncbi:MAG: hypothetical protein MK132_23930 [Lentisphaerales bacterium]|nr:hypothetical protein [Lentisphaerales bacterium]